MAALLSLCVRRSRLSAVDLFRFSLTVQPDRDRVVVALAGDLDCATAPDVASQLDDLRAAGWERIALDVGAVTFADSAALHLLLDARARAAYEGWELDIAGACPPLDRVARITGVASLLGRD